MGLPLLTKALISKGFKDIAIAVGKAGGGAIIKSLAEKAGVSAGDASLDPVLAKLVNEGKQIDNNYLLEIRRLHIEEFQIATADTQDARDHYQGLSSSDKAVAQKIIDRTYWMLCICIVGIIGSAIAIYWATGPNATVAFTAVNSLLSMIAGALLKQMSSQNDFHFGSSIGSKTSGQANERMMENLLKETREDDKIIDRQTRYIAELPAKRPKAEDFDMSPDIEDADPEVSESIDQLISEQRR